MNDYEPQTADEWYAHERRTRIEGLQRQARRLYGQSSLSFDIGSPRAESTARRMLAVSASAFLNAEDTEFESLTHDEMDSYGTWVRTTFGCHFIYESGNYYQRCPVAIAHKRIGMSIGFSVRRHICSICGEDWSDCIHSPNELYDVPGGPNLSGYCRVCGIEECSEHSAERTYRRPPIAIVAEVEQLNEISFVPKTCVSRCKTAIVARRCPILGCRSWSLVQSRHASLLRPLLGAVQRN